jgi:hypothetical protein
VFPISDRSNLKQRVSTAIGAPLNKLGRIPVVELLATPLPLDEDDEDEDDDVHGGDHYAKRQKVLLANASASASSASATAGGYGRPSSAAPSRRPPSAAVRDSLDDDYDMLSRLAPTSSSSSSSSSAFPSSGGAGSVTSSINFAAGGIGIGSGSGSGNTVDLGATGKPSSSVDFSQAQQMFLAVSNDLKLARAASTKVCVHAVAYVPFCGACVFAELVAVY